MVSTAPVFDLRNLPDPKGVPFQGVKNAKIPGRESVANLIDGFIEKTRNDKNIQICLIKAEWGEGKTDAFDRYISTVLKHHYCYSVSTSTLAKKLRRNESYTHHSNTATNFLTALLTAVGDDLYSQEGDKGLFYKDMIKDPVRYLNEKLAELFENNQKKMYLFLDEFEEILYNEDIKADVISGIKEVINKKFGSLSEGGKYEGRLHIFVACTPYAWNTITEDPNFSQVMGSTEQRLAYNLIELPLLSRFDCYHFLSELVKVSYAGKLEKLPIASAGIFETIVNISQRNPRALIQLLYKLMSKAIPYDKTTICCIDYTQLFKELNDVKVSVYGSSTSAIEANMLDGFRKSLSNSRRNSEKLIKIFELLTGENKAFSIDEISERLSIPKKDISNLVNQINENLQNQNKLDSAFGVYYKLKEGRDFDSILSNYTKIEQGKNQYITVDYNSILIATLKESFTNYVISSNLSKNYFDKEIVIPKDPHELSRLLGIDSTIAGKFYHSVKNNFDTSNRFYRVSVNLLENVFPSPNLIKFDFIKDRSKRLELRRKIQRDLGDVKNRDKIHHDLKYALIDAIKLSDINCEPQEEYFLLKLNERDNPIPIIIEGIIENISVEKIDKIRKLVDATPAVLTLLFYQTHLEKPVHELLEGVGEIQRIPIDRINVEQLLCWKRAKVEKIQINRITEKSRISAIINELKLKQRIENFWIPKAEASGIIIPLLKELGDYSKSSIREAISSFISTSNFPIDEQWEFYKKLKSIKLFGSKGSFCPIDIETKDEWKSWAYGLTNNQFLKDINSVIMSVDTPVEKRVIRLLGKNKNSQAGLEQEFVNQSNAEGALQNYYLNTLIQKGKIRKTNNTYAIIKKGDAVFQPKINAVEKYMNESYPQDNSNGHFISQTKMRECRVISESDYIHVLQGLLDKKNDSDGDEELRLSKLIIAIYDYYQENVRPIITEANNQKAKLFKDTMSKFESYKHQIDEIILTFNKLVSNKEQHITSEIILESIQKKFVDLVQSEYEKTYERRLVTEETQSIGMKDSKKDHKKSAFYFEKSADDAYYFSLPYHNLKKAVECFDAELDAMKRTTDKTNSLAQSIKESYREIKAATATFVFPSAHKISSGLHKSATQIKPPALPKTTKIKDLKQIEEYFSTVSQKLAAFNQRRGEILEKIKEVDQHECTFLKHYEECKKCLEDLSDFIVGSEDVSDSTINTVAIQKKINDMKKSLNSANKEYLELPTSLSEIVIFVKCVTEINSNMKDLSEQIEQINIALHEIIKKFIEAVEAKTKTLVNFVNICSKNLPESKQVVLIESRMDFEKFSSKLKDHLQRMNKMTWIKMVNELNRRRDVFMKKIIQELDIDRGSAGLLQLVSDVSSGKDYVDPGKLEPGLNKVGNNLFDPAVTKSVQILYEKGFVKLGIALNSDEVEDHG